MDQFGLAKNIWIATAFQHYYWKQRMQISHQNPFAQHQKASPMYLPADTDH
jgi:hypothetical protein